VLPAPGRHFARLAKFAGLTLTTALLAACSLPSAQDCAPAPDEVAEIMYRGLIDCFPEGLQADGKPVYCEASAAAWDGQRLTVASDKPIPGANRSAAFTLAYRGDGIISSEPVYLTQAPFKEATKYEDMALTPDGRYVLATTGFDRMKTDSHEWDGFNTLLIWPVEDPEQVKVVSATTNEGITSSISLREPLSQALILPEFPDGVPYFKVESIAAVPGDRLLFGIRELGLRYDEFAYSFKIVSVDYRIVDGNVQFTSDFELVYDLDTSSTTEGKLTTALSSIEYDSWHERLYLLTSYENGETDESLGGFLWTLTLEDLDARRPPQLVRSADGEALMFAHKAEAVAVLGAQSLVVIHDDDKVLGRAQVDDPDSQFSRAPHQSAYTLVKFSTPPGDCRSPE
jgi:hypothetical protein